MRNSVASSPSGPTSCMPIGRPVDAWCNGSEIAGWPLQLNAGRKLSHVAPVAEHLAR